MDGPLHRIAPTRETVGVAVAVSAIGLAFYALTGSAFATTGALLPLAVHRSRTRLGVSDRTAALVLSALSLCITVVTLYYGVVVPPRNWVVAGLGVLFLGLAYSFLGDARRASGADPTASRREA